MFWWFSFDPEEDSCCVWLISCFFLLFSGASTVSGFFASACSLPFDYVKTQIQKMQPDAQGKYPYTGSMDCAMKTLKAGGPFKFYTGFPVYCVRIAPHVMVISLLTSVILYHLCTWPRLISISSHQKLNFKWDMISHVYWSTDAWSCRWLGYSSTRSKSLRRKWGCSLWHEWRIRLEMSIK